MAERTGLEPATPGVTGRYSNQLNYRSALVLSLIHTDAADERSSVDLGGRRIIKKKKQKKDMSGRRMSTHTENTHWNT